MLQKKKSFGGGRKNEGVIPILMTVPCIFSKNKLRKVSIFTAAGILVK